MSSHDLLLTDIPLQDDSEDLFGYKKFTDRLTDCIKHFSSDDGLVVALNGEWGSGKTSVINIVKNQLKKEKNIHVISYSYWWYEGKKEVITAFLSALSTAIGCLGNSDEIASKLKKIMQVLVPIADLISQSNIPSKVVEVSEKFFNPLSLEQNFQDVREFLKNQDNHIVIFIDDLDRMDPEDSIQVFKLLKTIGRLPKVTFVIVYDKKLAHSILKQHFPYEGQDFLEKVIQVSFDMPVPTREVLHKIFIDELIKISSDKLDRYEIGLLRCGYLYEFIKTPRNLGRLLANLKFNINPVIQDVYIKDFIALEILRLYFPTIYQEIAHNKHQICQDSAFDLSDTSRPGVNDSFISFLISKASKEPRETLEKLLEHLLYPSISVEQRKSEKRLSSTDHFDTYFNLNIDSASLSDYEVEQFLNSLREQDIEKNKFIFPCKDEAKERLQYFNAFLKELGLHVEKIKDDSDAKKILMSSIKMVDKLYDPSEILQMNQNENVYQMLLYVLGKMFKKFSIHNLTAVIKESLEIASVNWDLEFLNQIKKLHWIFYIERDVRDILKQSFRSKVVALIQREKFLNLGNRIPLCIATWEREFKDDQFLCDSLEKYFNSDDKVDQLTRSFLLISISDRGERQDNLNLKDVGRYLNLGLFYEGVHRASRNNYENARRFELAMERKLKSEREAM